MLGALLSVVLGAACSRGPTLTVSVAASLQNSIAELAPRATGPRTLT